MAKVFVVNKSSHDFSRAMKFGELIFMSEGRLDKFGTNNMHRLFNEFLATSSRDDYILPCSLSIANIIAASIFAVRHGKLNLLLHKPSTGEYIERNHLFE